MKKKKNTLIAVGLLVAVIGLGIGYAINTQTLKVEGTATAQESASSFSVKFKEVSPTTAVVTRETTTNGGEGAILTSVVATKTSDTVATMTAVLTNIGDEVEATFTIENASQSGLGALVSANNVKVCAHGTETDFTSEYFEVIPVVTTTTIPSTDNTETPDILENTMTFTVKVKLIKAYVSDDDDSITENFDIVLKNIKAVQE